MALIHVPMARHVLSPHRYNCVHIHVMGSMMQYRIARPTGCIQYRCMVSPQCALHHRPHDKQERPHQRRHASIL